MTAISTDDGNSRDHWVPQFYLRRWITGPEKKLSAFWRENGRERHSRCSPRAVLSENHLYSVYGVDGAFMHGESLIFKDIDNAAAPAFEYLADGHWKELPQQLVAPFYRFIYTLAPRSRHMRESFIQRDERLQSEVIGRLRKMGLPGVDEEVRQFWSQFASPRDRAALQMLLIARCGDSWKGFFNDIPLYVYEIGDVDAEFFTSDAPLCSRPSIDADDAIHVFPLSPKRCMVASHDPANVTKLCGAPLPIFVSVKIW